MDNNKENSDSQDIKLIEHTLDNLLDLAFDEYILILFKKLCRHYYAIDAWHEIWDTPAVAARRSLCFENCPGPASAWIRMGEFEAQSMECADYSKKKFKKAHCQGCWSLCG